MLTRPISALFGLLLAMSVQAGAPVLGQETDTFIPAAGDWETYVNGRYGFRLDFPTDVFTPADPPENGDGRTFISPDATLQAFAFEEAEGATPATLKRELIGGEGYGDVTYSPSGANWLVLSGFRGDMIFYEKYFFGDVISAFGMEFPASRKPFYAPIIERIEDSFRAGRPN